MEKKQKLLLQGVNGNLRDVVAMAEVDFISMNLILKECYAVVNLRPEEMHQEQEVLDEKIKVMMSGLQYMDIFNQRVDHLIQTHEQMEKTAMAKNFEESFFHLHVFQSMTIELDLLRSISSINAILCDVKNALSVLGTESILMKENFVNTDSIKNILHQTVNALAEAGGETRYLPIPVLTEDQIHLLNSLYTMDSERVVLTWFLNSMPSGTWEDLLSYYESSIKEIEKEDTELF